MSILPAEPNGAGNAEEADEMSIMFPDPPEIREVSPHPLTNHDSLARLMRRRRQELSKTSTEHP